MVMQKGEKYRCQDEECGCEIAVTRSCSDDSMEDNPRCCCGSEMEKAGDGERRTKPAERRSSKPEGSQERPQRSH